MSSYKTLKQQLNSEKQWKMRWRAKTHICFWLSYVVFMSSAWKEVGMTVMYNWSDVINIMQNSNGTEEGQRENGGEGARERAELWNMD